jgi:hypothetical protein
MSLKNKLDKFSWVIILLASLQLLAYTWVRISHSGDTVVCSSLSCRTQADNIAGGFMGATLWILVVMVIAKLVMKLSKKMTGIVIMKRKLDRFSATLVIFATSLILAYVWILQSHVGIDYSNCSSKSCLTLADLFGGGFIAYFLPVFGILLLIKVVLVILKRIKKR